MKKFIKRHIFLFLIAFLFSGCHAQSNHEEPGRIDRQPAVSGTFYPADKNELLKMVELFFNQSKQVVSKQPLAVIVPHAGYVFSGKVAASAYKQIDRNIAFDHVFIIGSSHTTHFEGASVYTQGDFITPLGYVRVDTLATWLDKNYSIINNDLRPHISEHSLEVQLPFLQFWLKKPFTIIPMIIGGESQETSKKLAAVLDPFFNEKNLFIISTDFAHYPDAKNASQSDQLMADAVSSNSSQKFMKTKIDDESRNIPNLVTAMCGWTSVLTLLDITENHPDIVFRKIEYMNSGDTEYGDKEKVVGYNSMVACSDKNSLEPGEFILTGEDKIMLLKIARKAIQEYLAGRKVPVVDENSLSPGLRFKAGAFVTIMEHNKLRGCIGNMQSSDPLYKLIQSLAVSSSTRDYRFEPVTAKEFKDIEIEISVLTPMRKINSIDEIEMGKHGIYIRKGVNTGTYLPKVADETHWSKEEFLGHCSMDKAGIGWEGWKGAEIYIYEALVFSERDFIAELK